MGVIASRPISPGELVLTEKPMFLISAQEMVSARCNGRESEEAMVRHQLDRLSEQAREAFWDLADCHSGAGTKTAFGVWQTNAIATGEDSAETQNGLYLVGCRFNHNCRPNVNRCWIDELQVEVFHATQDIELGEELSICYIDPKSLYAERQKTLTSTFNFTCRCDACSLHGIDREDSDKIRREYQKLDKALVYARDDPQRYLESVFRMLDIIEIEFEGDPHLAQRVFHDGFQVAVLVDDLDLASTFMQRAYEAKTIAEGAHAKASELKAYAENPSSHPLVQTMKSAGASNSLRTDLRQEDVELLCQPCGPTPPVDQEVAGNENLEPNVQQFDFSVLD